MKKINENIKQLRMDRNLSQKQFADLIGKTPAQVSNYERGSVDIPASVIYDIAEKTGADLLFLMTGEEPEISRPETKKYDAEFRVYRESDREVITPILVANGYDVGQHKRYRSANGKALDYFIHITDNPDNMNQSR